jgi:hypothetical protein
MDSQKVDLFIASNGKYFSPEQIFNIKERLDKADDSKWMFLQSIGFRDPTIVLVLSLFCGAIGIDRFMLGQVGLGILKLITFGGIGIWTIIDWFTAMRRTKEYNLREFQKYI